MQFSKETLFDLASSANWILGEEYALHDMQNPPRITAGMVRWRVRVAPGELTCLQCGETTPDAYCPRCSLDDEGQIRGGAQLVPTLSYLRDGEWEVVG